MSLQNDASFPPLPNLDLAFVEGGSFRMGNDDEDAYGDEKIIHTVIVPSFFMAKFPVTQRLWNEVMNVTPDDNPSIFKGDRRPQTNVSWEEVQAFIQKLNALPEVQRFVCSLDPPSPLTSRVLGTSSQEGFRLPTEADGSLPLVAATKKPGRTSNIPAATG